MIAANIAFENYKQNNKYFVVFEKIPCLLHWIPLSKINTYIV
jgi:hypothetical protein